MPVKFYSRSIRQKRTIGRRTMEWRLPLRVHGGGLMGWSYKQSTYRGVSSCSGRNSSLERGTFL